MGDFSPANPPAPELPGAIRYLPGEIIDNKYRLEQPLGEGGMGTVWTAHNVVLDVGVAIKLIGLEGAANSQQLSERLLQEARAAARLGHPAIVRVFDFGVTRHGDPFVVMELLRGETLADLLNRDSRLPAIRGVQTLLPIADALSAAHAKGIVHRDVKPENIILARDEAERAQPKLLDFGIASFTETNRKLTLAGAVLGTPDYMSPEQAGGEARVDFRTDVWSFCVVLYELLTGTLPFDGPNYNALLRAIIRSEPVPITDHAAGDQQLWTIIARGLHKDPTQRWESMRVLGEALALWLYERGVREDICAASLKTAWLESGLAGLTIDVTGESGPVALGTDRPTPMDPLSSDSIPEIEATLAPDSGPRFASSDSAPRAIGEARPTSRRWRIVAAGGVLLALAAGSAWALRSQRVELTPRVAEPSKPPPLVAPEPGGAASPEKPSLPAPASTAVASERPAARTAHAPSLRGAPPRTTAPREKAEPAAPAKADPPKKPAPGAKDVDFGF